MRNAFSGGPICSVPGASREPVLQPALPIERRWNRVAGNPEWHRSGARRPGVRLSRPGSRGIGAAVVRPLSRAWGKGAHDGAGPTGPSYPKETFVIADLTTVEGCATVRAGRRGTCSAVWTSSCTCLAARRRRRVVSPLLMRPSGTRSCISICSPPCGWIGLCCRGMLAQGSGVIIHVTSIQDRLPLAGVHDCLCGGEGGTLHLQQEPIEGSDTQREYAFLRVSPGWVETEASVAMAEHPCESGRHRLRGWEADHHEFARRHSARPPVEADRSREPHRISLRLRERRRSPEPSM